MTTLTRDQIEALDTLRLKGWRGEMLDSLRATALLAWTEDGRLWRDVAEEWKSGLDTLGRVAESRIKELKDALAATALLAHTDDGKRLWKDVALELAKHIDATVQVAADALQRAEAAELALATERARREACEAALREIRDSPHCAYELVGNNSYSIGVTDGHRCAANTARAALNPAKENAGE